MPDGLQQFAEANPFTTVADAVRSLWIGTPANTDVWMAFVWCFVLLAVFAPLAVSRYRHGYGQIGGLAHSQGAGSVPRSARRRRGAAADRRLRGARAGAARARPRRR